jgi:hypothetical protein
MSKDKKKGLTTDNSDLNEVELVADSEDEALAPPELVEGEPDDDFEFDMSLLPKGIKLVDLTPDYVRPEGFLMVPRINKKTGEILPATATFAGILHDVVEWTDNRGKKRVWFACTAAASFKDCFYTGRDEKNEDKPFVEAVKKEDRIGISGTGAINALRSKKGHFIYLHWTGNKVTVKNGDMWEVKAKVSEEPVIKIGA